MLRFRVMVFLATCFGVFTWQGWMGHRVPREKPLTDKPEVGPKTPVKPIWDQPDAVEIARVRNRSLSPKIP
jgi:hypothetical protein